MSGKRISVFDRLGPGSDDLTSSPSPASFPSQPSSGHRRYEKGGEKSRHSNVHGRSEEGSRERKASQQEFEDTKRLHYRSASSTTHTPTSLPSRPFPEEDKKRKVRESEGHRHHGPSPGEERGGRGGKGGGGGRTKRKHSSSASLSGSEGGESGGEDARRKRPRRSDLERRPRPSLDREERRLSKHLDRREKQQLDRATSAGEGVAGGEVKVKSQRHRDEELHGERKRRREEEEEVLPESKRPRVDKDTPKTESERTWRHDTRVHSSPESRRHTSTTAEHHRREKKEAGDDLRETHSSNLEEKEKKLDWSTLSGPSLGRSKQPLNSALERFTPGAVLSRVGVSPSLAGPKLFSKASEAVSKHLQLTQTGLEGGRLSEGFVAAPFAGVEVGSAAVSCIRGEEERAAVFGEIGPCRRALTASVDFALRRKLRKRPCLATSQPPTLGWASEHYATAVGLYQSLGKTPSGKTAFRLEQSRLGTLIVTRQ